MKKQEEIVDQYTITGVPISRIPAMCKELDIDESLLMDWLTGQTMGLVGGEGVVYPWDIKRFLRGLPVID